MVKMVPFEAFACSCGEGDVVLRQSYKPESYGKLYYACPKSKVVSGIIASLTTQPMTRRGDCGEAEAVEVKEEDGLGISGKHKALFLSFLGDMVREHIGLKILAWNKVGSEARDKLWDEITVKSAAGKMARSKCLFIRIQWDEIEKKEIEQDEEPTRGTLWLKGRVNKDGEYQDDEIRSVGDKLKETEDKIKIRTSRESQLDAARREREEKELLIKSMSSKMSQTKGMVSLVEIYLTNSSADEEGGTTVVGSCFICIQETVKSVGAKRTTRSIRKDSSSQDSQSKENVSVLPQAIKCRLWHLKKSTIIAEGTVYKSDGKIMLHNKALPKDCINSIDKSSSGAAFIPGCKEVIVPTNSFSAEGGFCCMAKESSCF
ncbi:hypothetical protein Tco_0424829 [Tanacetum coccineum]